MVKAADEKGIHYIKFGQGVTCSFQETSTGEGGRDYARPLRWHGYEDFGTADDWLGLLGRRRERYFLRRYGELWRLVVKAGREGSGVLQEL